MCPYKMQAGNDSGYVVLSRLRGSALEFSQDEVGAVIVSIFAREKTEA